MFVFEAFLFPTICNGGFKIHCSDKKMRITSFRAKIGQWEKAYCVERENCYFWQLKNFAATTIWKQKIKNTVMVFFLVKLRWATNFVFLQQLCIVVNDLDGKTYIFAVLLYVLWRIEML